LDLRHSNRDYQLKQNRSPRESTQQQGWGRHCTLLCHQGRSSYHEKQIRWYDKKTVVPRGYYEHRRKLYTSLSPTGSGG